MRLATQRTIGGQKGVIDLHDSSPYTLPFEITPSRAFDLEMPGLAISQATRLHDDQRQFQQKPILHCGGLCSCILC
jgi:hypothetical protein